MSRKNCVLVIEPDPEMRRRICALVEGLGCETQVASGKALAEGLPWGCDLVLWSWEDWAAWVASAQRRGEEHALPLYPQVVLLTRLPDECLWIQALRAGALDLIEVPSSAEATSEFRRVVAGALGLPETTGVAA